MQVALFEWRGWRVNQLPALRLLYAIPNGGYRPKVTGRRMKAEGAKRGIPDTHLAVARQGFHSLYIELKRPGGASSPEQLEMQALLREAGHRVEVCYSTLDAIDVIEEYLGVPEAERSRHAYLY